MQNANILSWKLFDLQKVAQKIFATISFKSKKLSGSSYIPKQKRFPFLFHNICAKIYAFPDQFLPLFLNTSKSTNQ